jgi:hypothetical protein
LPASSASACRSPAASISKPTSRTALTRWASRSKAWSRKARPRPVPISARCSLRPIRLRARRSSQGGASGIGPNLFGIVGQPIGKHAAGFAYSGDLADHGGDWTYENLDHWLKSPKAFAAGTKMTFAGLGKAEDRANLLAFLKANGGGPDFPAPAAPAAAEGEAAAAPDAAATEATAEAGTEAAPAGEAAAATAE